jgi:hypothetical protein
MKVNVKEAFKINKNKMMLAKKEIGSRRRTLC